MNTPMRDALDVFSTCPPSSQAADLQSYVRRVADVARWSEQCGCRGILVYSDNSQVDPWMLSHLIVDNTTALCPLVAVQPIYMHPYTVAKVVASIGALRQRRVYLNMVAGGFKNDLTALADATPHDRRYDRLAEYTLIVRRLLESGAPLTFHGEFYQIDKLKLTPALPPELRPGIFISGSSEAGLAAARAIGATAIKYPKPADEEAHPAEGSASGIRVGIIARETAADAWSVAHARFPDDRKGQITRQLATKVSDSVWHKELSGVAVDEQSPYWMVPFNNYQTMCPYLVGSYEQVSDELSRYLVAGYRTVILDVPPDLEDLQHTTAAFARAVQPVH